MRRRGCSSQTGYVSAFLCSRSSVLVLSDTLTHVWTGDPWREATVASDFSIQLTLSEDQPHALADGAHCTDMLISNTTSERVHALQQSALGYMKKWHAEWTPTASHSG